MRRSVVQSGMAQVLTSLLPGCLEIGTMPSLTPCNCQVANMLAGLQGLTEAHAWLCGCNDLQAGPPRQRFYWGYVWNDGCSSRTTEPIRSPLNKSYMPVEQVRGVLSCLKRVTSLSCNRSSNFVRASAVIKRHRYCVIVHEPLVSWGIAVT